MKELEKVIPVELTRTGLNLPANITREEWVQYGKRFSQLGGAVQWGWGDWWNSGDFEYGERKALVESDDWDGPAYETLRKYGETCRVFENGTRVPLLSYRHHQECASLPLEEAQKVLQWAVKEEASIRNTIAKVKEVKAWLAQGWTSDQLERQQLINDGVAVVANKEKDSALIAWADQQGLMVEIDRGTIYGNPFILDQDGDRGEVCDWYHHNYFPVKRSLHRKVKELKGKVLVCHCYPERCHGDTLAKWAESTVDIDKFYFDEN